MSNRHSDLINVPLFAVLIFCINRFFVISFRRINESQRTTVAVMPMTGTIIIIVTEQRQYVVNQFKFPIMSMVGILKLSTYFLRMVINDASVFFIKLRIILTLNNYLIFLIENSNELIPVQSTFRNFIVQEIGYFAGLECLIRLCSTFIDHGLGITLGINTSIQIITNFYLTTLDIITNDTADIVVLAFKCTDVIAAEYIAGVITDDTANKTVCFDRTHIIANLYNADIVANDTADAIITGDIALVITSRYHTFVFTNDTTDIVVAVYGTRIVAIFNGALIATNNTADAILVTEDRTILVITISYCSFVITDYSTNISVSMEIRVHNTNILDHVILAIVFDDITEQTDITVSRFFVIQAGYGMTVTVKVSFECKILILTDRSPYADTVSTLIIECYCQNICIHSNVLGQFTVDGGITAIDCRSKSIQLLYRVNLIKTVSICVFQNDGFRTHRNGQVICSFCCINRQRKNTENRERHNNCKKNSQKARFFHCCRFHFLPPKNIHIFS